MAVDVFYVPPSVLERYLTMADMIEVVEYYDQERKSQPGYEPTQADAQAQLDEYLAKNGPPPST